MTECFFAPGPGQPLPSAVRVLSPNRQYYSDTFSVPPLTSAEMQYNDMATQGNLGVFGERSPWPAPRTSGFFASLPISEQIRRTGWYQTGVYRGLGKR